MSGYRTDADDDLHHQLGAHRVFNLLRQLLHSGYIIAVYQLFNDHNIGLADAEHKVGLLIREQTLNHVQHHHVRPVYLLHQHNSPGNIRDEPQFLCSCVHIAGKNVIGNNILHECCLVVFFLVIDFCLIQRNAHDNAQRRSHLVISLDECGILKTGTHCAKQTIRSLRQNNHLIGHFAVDFKNIVQLCSNHRKFITCDHVTLVVNHANLTVRGVFHLIDDALEHSV